MSNSAYKTQIKVICIQKVTLHSIHNCMYVLNNEKSLQICQLYCVCLLQGGVHIKIKVLNLQLAATALPSNYIAILQLKNCSLGKISNLYNSLKQNIPSYIVFQMPKAHHLKHLCIKRYHNQTYSEKHSAQTLHQPILYLQNWYIGDEEDQVKRGS